MTPDEIEAATRRAQKWLALCPIHDAGVAGTCRCPESDPRAVIADLLAALAEAQRREELMRPVRTVYKCRFCEFWHTGHKIKGKS